MHLNKISFKINKFVLHLKWIHYTKVYDNVITYCQFFRKLSCLAVLKQLLTIFLTQFRVVCVCV